MKRRGFLKFIAGVISAAVVGPKIEPASTAPAAPRWEYVVNNHTDVFQPISRAPVFYDARWDKRAWEHLRYYRL